jgi:hypothetical protein
VKGDDYIKLYDWQKIVLAIADSILKSKNKTLIVSPNEDKKQEAYNNILKILSYDPSIKIQSNNNSCTIYFENGSTIECDVPQPKFESDCIRGQRVKMDHWYYEYEVPEDIDEVLKPFEKMKQERKI